MWSSRVIRRALAALTVAGATAVATLPAGASALDPAAPPPDTAMVDVHAVVAGHQQPFTITVTNPKASGPVPGVPVMQPSTPAVNAVRITIPSQVGTIASVTPPTGWSGRILNHGDDLVFLNGSIAAGASQAFSFLTTLGVPAADRVGTWQVQTSTDGGNSFDDAVPASAGGLDTAVRVLELGALVATDAYNANDVQDLGHLEVTEGQQDVPVQTMVVNHGSAPLDVDVSLGGIAGGAPAHVRVPAGGSTPAAFAVDFGAPADLTLTASATSGTVATALNEPDLDATVVEKFGASVVGGSLSPTDLRQSTAADQHPYTFGLTVNPSGAVDLTLTTTSVHLKLAGGAIDTTLATPTSLSGGGADTALTFHPIEIASTVADGTYTNGELSLVGTDSNGAPVDLAAINVTDPILVDSSTPVLDVHVTLPVAKVQDDDTDTDDSAATNNSTISFSGTAKRGPVGALALCGACTITNAVLTQLAADGETATGAPKPVTLTNNGGNVSGSTAVGTWAANTALTQLEADVTVNGKSSHYVSPAAPVDIVAPKIAAFVTGGDNGTTEHPVPDDPTKIAVVFSEPVILVNPATNTEMGFLPTDFSCQGLTIKSVTMDAHHKFATLTVDPALTPDQKPTCTYGPEGPELHDRVALNIDPATMVQEAKDGIVPGAATLASINLRGPVNGVYWVNETTPETLVTGVQDGYLVELFQDSNRDGHIDLSAPAGQTPDVRVGTAAADGPSVIVDITESLVPATDGTVRLLTLATDQSGNPGPVRSYDLTIDTIAPVMSDASVVRSGQTLTLTFGEDLVGGASAGDWSAVIRTNGVDQRSGANTANQSGRTITLGFGTALGATSTVVTVSYVDVFGASLTDLAGNVLNDGDKTV